MNTVLTPIVEDIAELVCYACTLYSLPIHELVIHRKRQIHYYGTISTDNIGQCSIGGFEEGSTA